ncbi:hypothetical protein LTR09_008158 [Extremus antarcticus]|uniref:NAD(P)-binding protein n=1 Tax=Extremus antarcticus TaxID=702011 RepID=A0AAJ0DAW2_9PEZI|nr:hypothetical protein LTR09_008158 [Extremus antarcticus]
MLAPTLPSKTVLVTGCSSGGVGAAFASSFAAAGDSQTYHVYATARSPSKIPASLHSAPNVTVLALDVTSSDSIKAAVEAVRRETGERLDVLINNAGAGWNMPGLDSSIPDARKLFDLNFFSALETMQAFGPMLINAKGVVVNNASVGGMGTFPFGSIYGASKAALIRAGEAWRLELAPLGVRVLTLVTGGIATKFLENLQPLELPEGSYYAGIKDIIEKQEENISFGMKPEVLAEDVRRRVERGETGKVWVAGGATLIKWFIWLVPQWGTDRMLLNFKPFQAKLTEEHKKRMVKEEKKSA